MKKTQLYLVMFSIVLASLFFTIGVLSYPWMLDYIMTGNTSDFIAIDAGFVFRHYLITALSMACAGIVIGGSAMLYHRKGTLKASMTLFLSLIPVAIAAMAVWLWALKQRLSTFTASMAEILDGFGMTFPADQIRLYEIGLFACVCVMICAVVVLELQQKRCKKTQQMQS